MEFSTPPPSVTVLSKITNFFKNFSDIIILVLILLLLRGFVISPFQISGKSMERVLHDGELIITNKVAYSTWGTHTFGTPERGDVVVFRPPHNKNTYYIKRVIGIPGDVVSFQGHDVLVNSIPIQEPYLNCATFENGVELHNWCNYDNNINREPWTVPDGHYYLMGDNRNYSSDSRSCFHTCELGISPFVPTEDIIGKAWVVLWPFWQRSELDGPSGIRFAPNYLLSQ